MQSDTDRKRTLESTLRLWQTEGYLIARHGEENLKRWSQAPKAVPSQKITVTIGDVLDVVCSKSKASGRLFACCHSVCETPGGYAYGLDGVEDCIGIRTDLHFVIRECDTDESKYGLTYKPKVQELIDGQGSHVYIGKDLLFCFKDNLGRTLPYSDVTAFRQVRCAPVDCTFNVPDEFKHQTRNKLTAIFKTLIDHKMTHVVFDIFGLAFKNDPSTIAKMLARLLSIPKVNDCFEEIVFVAPDSTTKSIMELAFARLHTTQKEQE